MKNINITFRSLAKNFRSFALNVLGLSLAFASVLLVVLHVRYELSYDKFHTKYQRICRITQNSNAGPASMNDARMHNSWLQQLTGSYPQIEAVAKLNSFKKAIVTIDEKVFYSENVYSTDSSFFKVFDFELLQGNKETLFKAPNDVVITESIAKNYFGEVNPIGKVIKITNQKEDDPKSYVIQGVLRNFPENSHFKADLLCSFNELLGQNSWVYTYLLLNNQKALKKLQDTIQADWNTYSATLDNKPLVDLQPLAEIHFYSHKTRELSQNSNIKSLYLMISGAFMLLIIALVNFVNLSYVGFLKNKNAFLLKHIHGATRFRLIYENLSQSILLTLSSLFIAFLLAKAILIHFNMEYLLDGSTSYLLNVAIGFALVICTLGAIPLFQLQFKPIDGTRSMQQRKWYPVFVVLQLTLSVIAIISTITLQKQMAFISQIHPGAKEANLLVIPNNPRKAVYKFPVLKANLLQHPEILDVTATMEEPAGTVVDNFNYKLNGVNPENGQSINVLCIDSNFFTFFNIPAIAGTVDLGVTPSVEWEENSVKLWQLESDKLPISKALADSVKGVTDKYIINRKALQHLGMIDPQEAIGRKFRLEHPINYLFPQGEIVGVVDDFHYTNLYETEKPLAIVSRKIFNHTFIFRFQAGNASKAIHTIRSEWEVLYPEIPFQYELITQSYEKVYQNEFIQTQILGAFAMASLILSCLGVLAISGFMVQKRVKEIGIRKVNGAKVLELLKMLIRNLVFWVVAAFCLASPMAYYAMNRWLANFAYKTSLNCWVFLLAGFSVLFIALTTVSWQTWRASTRNPVEALRYE